MSKPLGILGGTFDPIHYGHLRPAQEVLRALDLAEVRVVPAANPPHRRAPLATAVQRLRMAELAVGEFPGLRVDDREIKRGGPSYTVLTLASLREELGDRPLCLLLGLDAFEGLESWHQWQRLPELAHIVVMTRPGWSLPAAEDLPTWARGRLAPAAGDLALASAGKLYFQTVTPQDISATRIREAIARSEPVDGLLPPAVLGYLRANRIYLNREN
ncbi:nicotinic acid mononucleotide adenylyltransferase [Sulfuricaulis limicola]|uniref:Probable nicotinate-nucleotide adenylyltransferase n=1 Tax=Sulfuricaulis limicola TaxID=1620215 RepID=A0A1B4XE16_9GAMM|nr:nicotinate-nucleotide adenylyltransferase [Sulfuricaulis limicola]BAV33054.1 nicotinic acid mononucleotide adenylyltransferase [Sulfuricaulis limicola]